MAQKCDALIMFSLTNLTPYNLLAKAVALVLLVISLYAAWHAFIGHYKDIGRTEIQVKFDKYKSDEDKLLQADNVKNVVLRAIADKQQSDLKLGYDKKLSDLNIDNVKLKKVLQNALPRITRLLADAKLHQNRSAPSISTVSKDALATELFTEGGRDSNGTIAIVTQAGQSCALDYDALYNAWMTECTAMGGCI